MKYTLTSGDIYEPPETFLRISEFRYELDKYHDLKSKGNLHIYVKETDFQNRFHIIILDSKQIVGQDREWSIEVIIIQSNRFHMVVHRNETFKFLESEEKYHAEI